LGDTLESLKDSRGGRTKDEAANVSHICDAARLRRCDSADLAEELNEKPEADQDS
jgi:hypothetical protein